ncbi:hypothetical protein P344_03295 [Spiroplasma mirum ATCC 29335]|uniref:ISXO2-like transposase domain-containing protein n=1 Tax=Spiroplasma mirum ATCC 29335 TaxID=838561 RepID=W0GQZ4_9MOLU|nr:MULTISPECIES: hypothetical protein [Spiroplasma]AHF60981.1 hypothetical protein SMM_0556 [Spiroplasma mirum ATCC 29335]AHI58002.1 hypothetical protein P344_03295 [Spiroplasma mirum ATCC 29335]AKM53083.1 hypothetical protein SATRI_v1c06110 [Spiroplasma atrichopogonis]
MKKSIYCPQCKGKSIYKNGKYIQEQRYLCRYCRKTFNFKTSTFLSWSHLTLIQWATYIQSFLLKLTCKETIELVNLSILNSWKNRIKLTKWIFKKLNKISLENIVWLDETYINETYKGNWKEKNKHRRLIQKQEYQKHHDKKLRETSKYKIYIITGVNYDKICFLTPSYFGKLKQNITNYVLNSYLKNIELLISDMELTYETYRSITFSF